MTLLTDDCRVSGHARCAGRGPRVRPLLGCQKIRRQGAALFDRLWPSACALGARADRTEWVVSALPLGGYVRMLDERDPDCLPIPAADLPRAFNRQPVWKRIAIVLAGPVANLLLAVAVYWFLSVVGVFEPSAVVGTPPPASAAARAGFLSGDTVVGVAAIRYVHGTNCAGCCCSARSRKSRSTSKSKAAINTAAN